MSADGDCLADFQPHQVLANDQGTIVTRPCRGDEVPGRRITEQQDVRVDGELRSGATKHHAGILGHRVVTSYSFQIRALEASPMP